MALSDERFVSFTVLHGRAFAAAALSGVFGGLLIALAGFGVVPSVAGWIGLVLIVASGVAFLTVEYQDARSLGAGRVRSSGRAVRRAFAWAFSLLP